MNLLIFHTSSKIGTIIADILLLAQCSLSMSCDDKQTERNRNRERQRQRDSQRDRETEDEMDKQSYTQMDEALGIG